jgi:hypothetical protein
MISRLPIPFIFIFVLACQFINAPTAISLSGFSDSQLVGAWEAQYSGKTAVEILVFNPNKTYLQIYEDSTGFLYTNQDGSWEIKRDQADRVFIHLARGLWLPDGPKIAQLANSDPNFFNAPHVFYDPATNSGITMSKELILEVIPRNNPKGFVLFQFTWDIDSASEHFEPLIEPNLQH